jgi:hypothetical protein
MAVMHALVIERAGAPLVMRERAVPAPGPGEVLIEIAACGVCRRPRHHLRPGRRARSCCARRGEEGWPRRVRRHPHVGHPALSVSPAVGGARTRLGRQPHPRRRAPFLDIAPWAGVQTETVPYSLEHANEALSDLREGRLRGRGSVDAVGWSKRSLRA